MGTIICPLQVGDCDGALEVTAALQCDGATQRRLAPWLCTGASLLMLRSIVLSPGKWFSCAEAGPQSCPQIWLITACALHLKTQFQMFKKLNMGCLRWITTDFGRFGVDAGERRWQTEPRASSLVNVAYWSLDTLDAFCRNMTSIDFCYTESSSHGVEIRQVRNHVNGANDQVTRSWRQNSARRSVLFKN